MPFRCDPTLPTPCCLGAKRAVVQHADVSIVPVGLTPPFRPRAHMLSDGGRPVLADAGDLGRSGFVGTFNPVHSLSAPMALAVEGALAVAAGVSGVMGRRRQHAVRPPAPMARPPYLDDTRFSEPGLCEARAARRRRRGGDGAQSSGSRPVPFLSLLVANRAATQHI